MLKVEDVFDRPDVQEAWAYLHKCAGDVHRLDVKIRMMIESRKTTHKMKTDENRDPPSDHDGYQHIIHEIAGEGTVRTDNADAVLRLVELHTEAAAQLDLARISFRRLMTASDVGADNLDQLLKLRKAVDDLNRDDDPTPDADGGL